MKVHSVWFVAILGAMILLSTSVAEAQRRGSKGGGGPATEFNLEIGGFYGFQMIGWAEDFTIVDAANFGGYASIPVQKNVRAEISYSRQNSVLEFRPGGIPDVEVFDISVEYFQLGAVTEMPGPPDRKVIPFGQVSAGAARFAPQSAVKSGWDDEYDDLVPQVETGYQYDDEWRFAMTLGLGAKIQPSERFGLRLQARALIPFNFTGGGFYCGTGGCGVGVGGTLYFFQIDASAGLYIVL